MEDFSSVIERPAFCDIPRRERGQENFEPRHLVRDVRQMGPCAPFVDLSFCLSEKTVDQRTARCRETAACCFGISTVCTAQAYAAGNRSWWERVQSVRIRPRVAISALGAHWASLVKPAHARHATLSSPHNSPLLVRLYHPDHPPPLLSTQRPTHSAHRPPWRRMHRAQEGGGSHNVSVTRAR